MQYGEIILNYISMIMATHYSQYFKMQHNDFVSNGIYNAFLDKDSLLHVDPLLLKWCTIPEFKDSYKKFLEHFQKTNTSCEVCSKCE